MPLKVIPNDESSLTKGEKQLLNRLKKLYANEESDSYIYLTPRVNELEPDFLLIDPKRGVSVLETKGWSFDYLATINTKKVVAVDGITRASEKLYMNSSSFVKGVGKALRELA